MALAGPDATAQSGLGNLESLQQELANLLASLARTHEKMAQIASAADRRTDELRAKVEELEAQNLRLVMANRDLHAENAELRRFAGDVSHESDVQMVVQERDKALKRVAEMAETIEELLNALMTSEAASKRCTCRSPKLAQGSSSGGQTRSHTQQRTPADSDEEKATIREQPRPTVPNVNRAATPIASSSGTAMGAGRAPLTPAPSQEIISTGSTSSSQATWDSPSSASRAMAKAKRLWYLEFSKPPSSVELQHGPIPFDILAERLRLSEDVQAEVGCLEVTGGYDTRIYADETVAFVYEPVILEGPGPTASYFIGWTTPAKVKTMKEWVMKTGDLQLFIWPVGETVGWRYIGLHSLTFEEMENKWPLFHQSEKHRLVSHLRERNGPAMDVAKFRDEVRSGKLLQVCIQLESKGEMESKDFLCESGLWDGD